MTIGKAAEQGGVNLQTIRYYEREKLLPRAPRMSSGYRSFDEETVRRIRFIKRAQELGFTLAEIRQLLSLRIDHQRPSAEVRALALHKIAEIEGKIQTLSSMKSVLEHLTDQCSGHGPAGECPILASIDSDAATH